MSMKVLREFPSRV